jgi:hypothetical protein
MTSRIAQLTVVDCLFVMLAQRDLPSTMDALERTFAAAQAKRVRRPRQPRSLVREDGAGPAGGAGAAEPGEAAGPGWPRTLSL